MAIREKVKQAGRGFAVAAAIVAAGWLTAPRPAHALGTGAAVGIGVGSFLLGTALAAHPYGGYYPYGYYYAPPAYYYPPAPAYYPPHVCWDPYWRRYRPC